MKSNLQLLTRLIFLLKVQIQKNLIKNSLVQVNLCQKLLFLSQLTHSMMTSCSLNYKFNTWKFQTKTWGEHVVYRNCFWHSEQFLYTTCSAHVMQKEELLAKIYLYLRWNHFGNHFGLRDHGLCLLDLGMMAWLLLLMNTSLSVNECKSLIAGLIEFK